jgi:phosphomethylpyrimidine synthase
MCGHDWCSMRISKEIVDFTSGKDPDFQPDQRAAASPGMGAEGRALLARRAERLPQLDGKNACHSEHEPVEEEARRIQEEAVV